MSYSMIGRRIAVAALLCVCAAGSVAQARGFKSFVRATSGAAGIQAQLQPQSSFSSLSADSGSGGATLYSIAVVSPVPELPAFWMLGAGLLVIGVKARKRR